ncbi:MAG: hypothetical protein EGS41_06695 [Prevotella sp.]|nr:hypothetical protein [Prevotella sp.]
MPLASAVGNGEWIFAMEEVVADYFADVSRQRHIFLVADTTFRYDSVHNNILSDCTLCYAKGESSFAKEA